MESNVVFDQSMSEMIEKMSKIILTVTFTYVLLDAFFIQSIIILIGLELRCFSWVRHSTN